MVLKIVHISESWWVFPKLIFVSFRYLYAVFKYSAMMLDLTPGYSSSILKCFYKI